LPLERLFHFRSGLGTLWCMVANLSTGLTACTAERCPIAGRRVGVYQSPVDL